MNNSNLEDIKLLWKDRKRILGMPITFTKYSLSEDRIFLQTGLVTTNFNEVILYRVRDISLSLTLWQRIFGVGTITVHSSDKTTPHLEIINIKKPKLVKELLHKQVEQMKVSRKMRVGELMDSEIEECNDDSLV